MTPNRRQKQTSHRKYNAVIPRFHIHEEGSRAQVMITHGLSVRMSSLVSRCVHHRRNRYLWCATRILHYRNIFCSDCALSSKMIFQLYDPRIRRSSNEVLIELQDHRV